MEKIEDHMGLVKKFVKKYHGIYRDKYEFDDLMQVGCMGLCKAIGEFNPDAGFKFSTFAFYKIRGEICNSIRDDRFYPTHPKQRFDASVNFISLNTFVDEKGKVELMDTFKSNDNLDIISESIDLQMALDKLSDLERNVIHLYYFKDLTQQEIGKLIGTSQNHVSRTLKSTLEKLKIYLA